MCVDIDRELEYEEKKMSQLTKFKKCVCEVNNNVTKVQGMDYCYFCCPRNVKPQQALKLTIRFYSCTLIQIDHKNNRHKNRGFSHFLKIKKK